MEARRGRGDLGQQILAVLESADAPLTPAQVHQALDADLAYTTVMTVMARLYDKGVLSRQRTGRSFAYVPLGDPARVTARRMHRVLAVEPDRAAALARFVDDLSPVDEATLRRLLGETVDGTGV
ncbi:BlaI/MecI/CopY family transcriptional regulator [Hamadaea sp. NPDC050747]|uniref:BlaI/MecI/CopY family transcriptional regulator n=1 Tax=Hamadaea sp. NPDC050747 TaxID=3155789 RepID=UPI0033F01F44